MGYALQAESLTLSPVDKLLREVAFLRDEIAEIKSIIGSQSQQSTKKLTRAEARQILGVSNPTILSYEKQGMLRPLRLGRKVFYYASDIESALQSGHQKWKRY